MDTTQRTGIMQRWRIVQEEMVPELRNEIGALTPKLVQVVHTLEWARIEEFVSSTWGGCGRPEHDRGVLASAFVAKAVLGISTTAGLIERLAMNRVLKRICGFSMWRKLPSESTFSRAFAEFAEAGLAERAHVALVKETLGEQLIGHISRDGTAIEAREKPAKRTEESSQHLLLQKSAAVPAKMKFEKLSQESLHSNMANRWRNCSRSSHASATVAASATHRVTKTAGTATSCTLIQRIVVYR